MSNNEKNKSCRNCTHFRAVDSEFLLGRCYLRPPQGELMEPEKALECQGKVHVFPLVAKGDVCSAFDPLPCAQEAISIKECTNRIADVFKRWHSRKGIDTPMPGWLLNRNVKKFHPDVIALAKGRLIRQGYLKCTPFNGNGLVYTLNITSEKN